VSPITLARNDGLGGLKGMDGPRAPILSVAQGRLRKGAALDSCWPVCSRLLVEFAQWQAVALGRRTARDCACRALLLHDKGRPFRAAFIGGPDSAQPCTRSALLSEAVSASDCVSLQ